MSSVPSPTEDSVDLGRGFRFVFDDPDWVKKMLIGGGFALLGMLLVGLFFVAGYLVRLIRRAASGEARPLPEWDDLGGIFNDGLKPVGIYLAYVALALLVPGAMGCVLSIAASGLSHAGPGGDALGAAMGLGIMLAYALMMILMLVLYVYVPAAITRAVVSDDFRTAFELSENVVWIRANIGPYAMTLLLYLLANFVAQFGILLCCVGLFPVSFWAMCTLGWGLGEVVRLERQRSGVAPVPPLPGSWA